MKWIEAFSNSYWKIEVSGTVYTQSDSEEFYEWEKSFVKITCLDYVNQGEILVAGESYTFYSYNEFVILEITDNVRSNVGGGGLIEFYLPPDTYLYELEWVNIAGERPTAENFESLPQSIPYDGAVNVNLIADSVINTESNLYGFGARTAQVEAGRTYTLTANGNAANAQNGKFLLVYIYQDGFVWDKQILISEIENTTKSVTFTSPFTGTAYIQSYYEPSSVPRDGSVHTNWYKLEAGEEFTGWSPNWADDDYVPFYIQGMEALTSSYGGYQFEDIPTEHDFRKDLGYYGIQKYLKQTDGDRYFHFIQPACVDKMILMEWVGRFGKRKSWYFDVEKIIHASSRNVSLQTLENGYNVLKNKLQNMIVSHKQADTDTQKYLSDIVLSDAVYVYGANGREQVNIDNDSFEVKATKANIQLTINRYKYDTI